MPELFFGESKKRYLIYCILIRPAFRKKLPAASISSANRLQRVVALHRKNAHGVPLFLSTIPFPVNFANSVSASQHWAGLFGLVGQINQRVYEIATRESGVYVLDMAGMGGV